MTGFSPKKLARMDARMAEWVASEKYERLEWAVGTVDGIAHQGRTADAASLFRIYSMTKPIVSVCALQLIEEGRLQLFHHVGRYLPEFSKMMVFTPEGPRPASRPMTVHHLMTHMAGLSYGFMADATGAMLNAAKVHGSAKTPLRKDVEKIAAIPLQFEPGGRWLYSVATDVLGAVLEEVEGKPLGQIIAERVTGPLEMANTSFCPGADAAPRIAPIAGTNEGSLLNANHVAETYPHDDPDFARGGHGLFSTLKDYAKFACALLNDARGGAEGRLLSAATLAHATANHAAPVMPIHIELPWPSQNPGMQGLGFGLGFSVAEPGGPMTARPGAFGWSGAAETWFSVDPASGLFMLSMAQNFDWPGAAFDLQNMAYGGLID